MQRDPSVREASDKEIVALGSSVGGRITDGHTFRFPTHPQLVYAALCSSCSSKQQDVLSRATDWLERHLGDPVRTQASAVNLFRLNLCLNSGQGPDRLQMLVFLFDPNRRSPACPDSHCL